MLGLIKDRLIMIVLLVLIFGIIGVGIWYAMFYEEDNKNEIADTNTNINETTISNENIYNITTEENTLEENATSESLITDLTSWNGMYQSSDGKSFYLCQTDSLSIYGNIRRNYRKILFARRWYIKHEK